MLPFTVLRQVHMDSDRFFVLQDPLGYKLLMPYDYYKHYGLKTGQTISCRIDKVNCNGRVFLEPMHPFYKEGSIYPFQVVRTGEKKNLAGELSSFLVVKDLLGKEWEVIRHHDAAPGIKDGQVNCLVGRIKKGVLSLRLQADMNLSAQLQQGKIYSFFVSGDSFDAVRNISYFVLADEHGSKHLLRKKHYLQYNISPGMHIRCQAGPLTAEGWVMLEPEHPCYRKAEVYDWKPDHLEELVFSDGNKQMVLVLKDCFGEDVKLPVDPEVADAFSQKETLRCRVRDIIKSRPLLELLPEDQQLI